jgi:hypothetical protein
MIVRWPFTELVKMIRILAIIKTFEDIYPLF